MIKNKKEKNIFFILNINVKNLKIKNLFNLIWVGDIFY